MGNDRGTITAALLPEITLRSLPTEREIGSAIDALADLRFAAE